MAERSSQDEARRWAKFPATVMFATGFLWLINSYAELDWDNVSQTSETFVGAARVFIDMVAIPLGSVAVGFGLLFLQRWAIWVGLFLPIWPLVVVSAEKLQRMGMKFSQARTGGGPPEFGDAVMTALLVLSLWAVYVLVVLYLLKTRRLLEQAQSWLRDGRSPRGRAAASLTQSWAQSGASAGMAGDEVDEFCLLIPDVADEDEVEERV
jgi:hypothetical protein